MRRSIVPAVSSLCATQVSFDTHTERGKKGAIEEHVHSVWFIFEGTCTMVSTVHRHPLTDLSTRPDPPYFGPVLRTSLRMRPSIHRGVRPLSATVTLKSNNQTPYKSGAIRNLQNQGLETSGRQR